MKDAAGTELASAIIGKAVADQTDQCYVREVGKEPVYIVQLDPSKLSVKFADWIEPNLLNINTMDLKQVHINDYSIERVVDPDTHQIFKAPVPHGEYRLDVSSGDQPWKLVEDLEADIKAGKMVEKKLAADEEINTQSLDNMKYALDDLKIVDVERKPAQVPADLRLRNMDEATAVTLSQRGFELAAVDQKKPDALEIVSKFGEINLQMSDGARYILRFGNTTGASSAGDKDKKAGTADATAPGMDRYLFVMADFNQNAIPKPALEQLPPEDKTAPKGTEKSAGEEGGRLGAQAGREERRDQKGRRQEVRRCRRRRQGQAAKGRRGTHREGEQAPAGGIHRQGRRRQEARRRAQQALRAVVLRHFRRRLPEDPPGPQGDRQEEGAAQGRARSRPRARKSACRRVARRSRGDAEKSVGPGAEVRHLSFRICVEPLCNPARHTSRREPAADGR